MINSIAQVNREFFSLFQGITIECGDRSFTPHYRYYKRSAQDYSEEQDQVIYPCIVVQDYMPTPKPEWWVDMKSYVGGISKDGSTGYVYKRPVWMNFRYDVSVVSKDYFEFTAMCDHFLTHFVYGDFRFIFNRQFPDTEYEVGDVVPYDVTCTDIPRRDGVYERNFEFNLAVWVYCREPIKLDLVKKVIVGVHKISLPISGPEEQLDWILADGTWNDDNFWVDIAKWIDE